MHVIWLVLAWLAVIGFTRLHAHWMVGRASVPARDAIAEPSGADPVPARFDPPRDRYGRYVSAKYAQHHSGGPGPGPTWTNTGGGGGSPPTFGGQRPPPPWGQWNPAEELGLPASLVEFQRVEFQRTPEMSVDEIRIGLRNWLLDNMDHFLDKKRANVGMLFCALDKNQWYGMPRAVPATAGRAAAAPKPKPPDKWCDAALEYYGFKNVLTLPKHLSEPEAWQPEPVAPPSVAAASSRAEAAEFNHRGTETQRTAVPGMVGRASVPAEDSASAKRVAQPSLAVKDSESATSSDRPIFGGHGGPPHQMSPPAATPAAVGHESIIPTERAGSPRSGTPSAFRLWPSALPDMPLDPRPETLDPVFQPP